jgi:hypothetical protein
VNFAKRRWLSDAICVCVFHPSPGVIEKLPRAGVATRYAQNSDDPNTSDYYACWMNDSDLFGCILSVGGRWTTMVESTATAAINPGEYNELFLAADGNAFAVIINDQTVAEFTDSTLQRGVAAVYVGNFETTGRATYNRFGVDSPAIGTAAQPAAEATATTQPANVIGNEIPVFPDAQPASADNPFASTVTSYIGESAGFEGFQANQIEAFTVAPAVTYEEIRDFYSNNLPEGWTGPVTEQTQPLDGGGQQQLAAWTRINQATETEQILVADLVSGEQVQESTGGDNFLVLFLLSR